jgi:outer membrane receptor for ferrienterochelin and colicin
MKIKYSLLSVLFSLSCFYSVAQISGKIAGFVKDAKTDMPIQGAIVTVEGTELGTSTDINGHFKIDQVPTRSHTVKATFIGYIPQFKFDVIVTSGNTYMIEFRLEQAGKELKEVKVVASPFKRTAETPLSVQTLSRQEIISYPGGNNDIAKVVQSLPGVSGSVGFRNDIIIRGGAPNENVYYLDGIEIPNINHFATQGSSGGPVGMINVSFIEDVTLTTGAFNARYDNPLSGVLQFKQRNGSSERTQGNFRIGASEAALTLEGPVSKKKPNTTYIVSVRRSYLQFIFKAIGLPFLPSYWDYQYKVNHKINDKNELTLIGLGSIDNFSYNPPARKKDEADEDWFSRMSIYDRIPIYTQWTTTVGISWRHRIGNGYFNVALSSNFLNNEAAKNDSNDVNKPLILRYRSKENESKLRFELVKFVKQWRFSYGANIINSNYTNSTFNLLRAVPLVEVNYATRINFFRYGFFGQVTNTIGKLSSSLGIRSDGNTFSNYGNDLWKRISPRASLSYALTDRWTINASVGRYYKIAPYTILGYKDYLGNYVNKDAAYIRGDQINAGIEFVPFKATRITVEGFYKLYRNYPVSNRDSISLANVGGDFGVIGNEDITSTGRGKSYGVEVCFQQKFIKNFYGILAYTFYYSRFTGFNTSNYIPSTWDNRHLLSFTGGYKFKRNWEIGVRYRFLGKAPYTPIDTLASRLNYGVRGAGIPDYNKVNSARIGVYSVMDIRIDKKWNFRRYALNIYLDVQNVLRNIQPAAPEFVMTRNALNQIVTIDGQPYNGSNGMPYVIKSPTSGTSIPTIGVIIEF